MALQKKGNGQNIHALHSFIHRVSIKSNQPPVRCPETKRKEKRKSIYIKQTYGIHTQSMHRETKNHHRPKGKPTKKMPSMYIRPVLPTSTTAKSIIITQRLPA